MTSTPLQGTDVVQVVTVVDDDDDASQLARVVVEARLAACVQVEGPVESTFRWDGEVRTEREWRVVAKTTLEASEAVVTCWLHEHPYDVPEILVVPVMGGHEPYLTWVESEVAPDPDDE